MPAWASTVRKDSAQSSKEAVHKTIYQDDTVAVRRRPDLTHPRFVTRFGFPNDLATGPGPSTTQKEAERADHIDDRNARSTCASAAAADIVTNDERAKLSTITRVLSPMRQRRTPVLVNAPNVRWRLGPRLQHITSLDSILSSSTTSGSEASTTRLIPISAHNIALPSTVASPLHTTTPEETGPVNIPLPPSPPPADATPADRHKAIVERLRLSQGHSFHQPHPLSPVTEASSGFSVRSLGSSIIDLEIQDITTAERRGVNEVRRQDVHVISSAHRSQASLSSQHSRHSKFQERFSLDGAEHYADSLRSGASSETPVLSGSGESADRERTAADEEYAQLEKKVEDMRKARTLCGRIGKLKNRVVKLGERTGQRVARKLGRWTGFEWV